MDTPTAPAVARPAAGGSAAAPVLAARDVVKRYGSREALAGVSVSASRGERVAIIGPNGAGKTTLLSILAGLERADAGEVERPRRVGWVPQQPGLYGKLTVEENLRLFARLERRADAGAAVQATLAQAGLDDRAGDLAATLSGGNRQRLNVAIGLVADPPALLLDEPSAALDPRQRERLWEFLLARSGAGTTLVYSTHDVREAELYADQVVVLADGERLFSGTTGELERRVGPAGLDFEAAFVAFLRERGH